MAAEQDFYGASQKTLMGLCEQVTAYVYYTFHASVRVRIIQVRVVSIALLECSPDSKCLPAVSETVVSSIKGFRIPEILDGVWGGNSVPDQLMNSQIIQPAKWSLAEASKSGLKSVDMVIKKLESTLFNHRFRVKSGVTESVVMMIIQRNFDESAAVTTAPHGVIVIQLSAVLSDVSTVPS
ncbi:hypothetical protein J6590_019333 [Homalodisca vitripennis]|nr:hypothetical protein J6590_019333 [Homalodisca vitripennis]